MMVGSGTTTVWCGVMFVSNLLLLFFTGHKLTHTKEKPFVCDVDGCGFKTAYASSLKGKWWCSCGCSSWWWWFDSVHMFVWSCCVGAGGDGCSVVLMKGKGRKWVLTIMVVVWYDNGGESY